MPVERLAPCWEGPLWPYVLAEAQHHHQGERLGPVGARIFAEVVIGLVAHDGNSFLNVEPCWTPAGVTTIVDLLGLAGEL